MSGLSTHNARLVAAAAIVAAIVFAAPVANALGFPDAGEAGLAGGSARTRMALRADEVISASSADEAIERLERVASQGEAEAPEWFLAEVGLLPDARDVRVDDSGQVVGYVVDCRVDETLDSLNTLMESRGWTAVPLGQVDGFTFIRQSGSCTWALVTCTQVGAATSVVIRTA